MGKAEKQAYLNAIRARYQKAGRREKSKILDEFCPTCDYNRKYALRSLNGAKKPSSTKKPGRPSKYACEKVMQVLRTLWLATDQLASKRLIAAIPLWLKYYEEQFGQLDEETRHKILTISAATIDRILVSIKAREGKKGLSSTKPGTLIKKQIPLQGCIWDTKEPRFMEADTVAHCGSSLAGDFIYSLTMTDLCTGWTECRATWNKGAQGVLSQIQGIQEALPFPIKGFDCDNGSEFLNWHLVRYFQEQKQPIAFTRSRPYHSNDNAHVEQKNWSCVRQLLGYDRLDKQEMVGLINDLYANEFSLLTNFFMPSMKLMEKKRVGAKIIKKHSDAQTPAQRLLDHPSVTEDQKVRLKNMLESLNPFLLQKQIQVKLKAIFKLIRLPKNLSQRL